MKVHQASFLVLIFAASQCFAQYFGDTFTGDATSYGPQSPPGEGECSFHISQSTNLPWTTSINYFVALDGPLYNNSQGCGLCLAFQGSQQGTPLPTSSPQYVLVADNCPGCNTGDLDFQNNYGGRFGVKWTPVQCNVGSSSFQYSFQGSNAYYIKLQISNTRVPVAAASLLVKGSYLSMQRSADNYFIISQGAPYSLPTSIRITSILGDTVTDVINTSTFSGQVQGKVQFPLSARYDIAGGGSPTTTPAPTPKPTPQPTARTTSPTLKPTATSSTPKSTATPSPAPLPTPGPTPAKTTASTCSKPLPPYSQCGGLGGSCTSGCADAQYPSTCCSPGYGSTFECTRGNPYYWQCVPSASGRDLTSPPDEEQLLQAAQVDQFYQQCVMNKAQLFAMAPALAPAPAPQVLEQS